MIDGMIESAKLSTLCSLGGALLVEQDRSTGAPDERPKAEGFTGESYVLKTVVVGGV
jgi:hypothetical protein